VTLAGIGTIALASRNTAGTYTLPAGNPVSSGTSISSTWANNTLGDLAAGLTDSLSRSGYGGMQAPIRTPDGTVAAPAHSFTNDSAAGLYRIGANDYGFAVGGVKQMEWNASGVAMMNGALARSNLPAVGQQISTSSGTFSTASSSLVSVTNLSVTLTTTGRPVMVFLQPDGSANRTLLGAAGTSTLNLTILRDGSAISNFQAMNGGAATSSFAPGAFLTLDLPSATSHTYTVQIANSASTTAYAQYLVLVAFEL
jgi:hypothetical protein